jgi:hypothetical protein
MRKRILRIVAGAGLLAGLILAFLLPGPLQPCPPSGVRGAYDCPGQTVGFFSGPRDLALVGGLVLCVVCLLLAAFSDS